MTTFKLKFTSLHTDTMEPFHVSETANHGWASKNLFLKSISNKLTDIRRIPNGYEEDNKEFGFTRRVEAIT